MRNIKSSALPRMDQDRTSCIELVHPFSNTRCFWIAEHTKNSSNPQHQASLLAGSLTDFFFAFARCLILPDVFFSFRAHCHWQYFFCYGLVFVDTIFSKASNSSDQVRGQNRGQWRSFNRWSPCPEPSTALTVGKDPSNCIGYRPGNINQDQSSRLSQGAPGLDKDGNCLAEDAYLILTAELRLSRKQNMNILETSLWQVHRCRRRFEKAWHTRHPPDRGISTQSMRVAAPAARDLCQVMPRQVLEIHQLNLTWRFSTKKNTCERPGRPTTSTWFSNRRWRRSSVFCECSTTKLSQSNRIGSTGHVNLTCPSRERKCFSLSTSVRRHPISSLEFARLLGFSFFTPCKCSSCLDMFSKFNQFGCSDHFSSQIQRSDLRFCEVLDRFGSCDGQID